MLLLKAIKSFSFALLAISLLKQAALLYSINRIDIDMKRIAVETNRCNIRNDLKFLGNEM